MSHYKFNTHDVPEELKTVKPIVAGSAITVDATNKQIINGLATTLVVSEDKQREYMMKVSPTAINGLRSKNS